MAQEAIDALTLKPVVTYSSERVRLWSEIADEVDGIKPKRHTPNGDSILAKA